LTHTISSPNSSEMDDQIIVAFFDVMDETMSILEMVEVTTAAASSSTRRPKRHRCYVNRDHEAADFKL
jgi:hypothetical protein